MAGQRILAPLIKVRILVPQLVCHGPHRLAVRTPASHVGNTGSIPVGVAIFPSENGKIDAGNLSRDGLLDSGVALQSLARQLRCSTRRRPGNAFGESLTWHEASISGNSARGTPGRIRRSLRWPPAHRPAGGRAAGVPGSTSTTRALLLVALIHRAAGRWITCHRRLPRRSARSRRSPRHPRSASPVPSGRRRAALKRQSAPR